MMLNMAVFAAMAMASVATTVNANAGAFRARRIPNRASSKTVARNGYPCASLHASSAAATLPNSRSAAARASAGDMPRAMFAAVCSSMWNCSSS